MFEAHFPTRILVAVLSIVAAATIGEAANQLRIRAEERARRRAFLQMVAVECALNAHSSRVHRERRLARR
ncbi:MAG: hypothetical protein R3D45_15935 [Rhizobiaceae bacterium]